MSLCVHVCTVKKLEPKILYRFWPNLHKTCNLAQSRCTRCDFDDFWKLPPLLPKKTSKNKFLTFYTKTAVTILINRPWIIVLTVPNQITKTVSPQKFPFKSYISKWMKSCHFYDKICIFCILWDSSRLFLLIYFCRVKNYENFEPCVKT